MNWLGHGKFIKGMEIMEVFSPYTDPNQRESLENFFHLRKSDRGDYFGGCLTQVEMNIKRKDISRETSNAQVVAGF